MENCIFCKIVAKNIPADIIYEDDSVMAFNDINPAAPVHMLIVPKKHIATLSDCDVSDSALLGKMLALAPKLAAQHGCDVVTTENGSRSGGFKTLINSGPDGGQEVYHLHMHVFGGPRPWKGMR